MGDVERWRVVTVEEGEYETHGAVVSHDARGDRWTVETDDGSTTIEAPHARGAIMLAFEGMPVAEIVAPGDRTCAEAMADARKAAARAEEARWSGAYEPLRDRISKAMREFTPRPVPLCSECAALSTCERRGIPYCDDCLVTTEARQ